METPHCGSRCLWCAVTPSTLSLAPLRALHCQLVCSLSCTSTSTMSNPSRIKTTALTHKEEYCTVTIRNLLTGYESKHLNNFDYSEISARIFQDESDDTDTEPSYSFDAELDDETIGKALSSPLLIQERRRTSKRETSLSLS